MMHALCEVPFGTIPRTAAAELQKHRSHHLLHCYQLPKVIKANIVTVPAVGAVQTYVEAMI